MMTDEIIGLLNLGPKSTLWLNEIGVYTREELEQLGVVTAFSLIKGKQEQASINLLYALYGALHNIHWNEIPSGEKLALQAEVAGFRFGEA